MKVRVRKGDTFVHYARIFRIPVELIIDSNPQIKPRNLQVGQNIDIPGYRVDRYKIKAGDTLWSLAKDQDFSMDALQLLNQSADPTSLNIGQIIYIPRKVSSFVVSDPDKYTYEKLNNDLKNLTELYPFIRMNIIGKSVIGRPLYELEIGKGARIVHFNGAFHANEWITTPVVIRLINEFALALINNHPVKETSAIELYRNNKVSAVPMVNPDGVNLVINGPDKERKTELLTLNERNPDFSGWKANIRGVDLNNQFPAKWEIEKERKEPKSPAPRDYPGNAPFTEPEAIAMGALAQMRQFDRMLAFHTQGKEFYWGYEGFEPQESERLALEFARASGYTSVRYIDSHAGYKDWFIQTYRRPGFTFELGLGVNPIPITQFPEIYREMREVFFISLAY